MDRRRRTAMSRSIILCWISIVFLAIWVRPSSLAAGEGHGDEEHTKGQLVVLSEEDVRDFGVQLSQAGPLAIASYVHLAGEVRANQDRVAHIVPRFSGIVSEVRAHIGDKVEPGQVLAVIESDESLAPYELKTLIGGTIIEKHITLGEALSRDVVAFVVADLSTVWVDLAVYQRDLGRVRVGQEVEVSTNHHRPVARGIISYVTPTVDERTRTATARVVISNDDGSWRPGMFVTARVKVGEAKVDVGVPRTALHTLDGETVVFVQTGEGFAPRPVRIGRQGRDAVEILEGLEPGEVYVSRGGFVLKAQLQREAFGEGHGH
jgi:cobalt-zinc-cadmium efflux system membrane fusion protein